MSILNGLMENYSLSLERTSDFGRKMEKRNDDQSIMDARARYLERKQLRMQQLNTSSNETS